MTKLGKYCKDVPEYIAMESIFKLLFNMKQKAYQLVRNVHQATGAYQYHIVDETSRTKIRTAIRHIQP